MSGTSVNGTRKLYRVVRDQVRTIQPSVFKSQLEDTSDIVVAKQKLAPRTKRGMVHHFYDHLENYFVTPGRKIPSRPLQKIFDRHLNSMKDAVKVSASSAVSPVIVKAEAEQSEEEEGEKVWMDGMELEPLSHDLRTPATKNVPNMEADKSVAGLFPTRNRSDIRRSYVRKKPKAPVPITASSIDSISLPSSTAAVASNAQSTNFIPQTPSAASSTMTTLPPVVVIKQEDHSFSPVPIIISTATTTVPVKGQDDSSSASPSPSNSKVVGYATRSRSRSGSPSKHQNQKEVVITSDIPTSTEFVVGQFAIGTEVSLDDSGVISSSSVNSNVLDLSDLIQTPTTHSQPEPKIEGNSGEIVFCTELEDMSEVVVMDQNGERYRFVALNDGQLSLVAADSVQ